MKNRTTILFVCLLVALAQGDLINWAGNWDIMTTSSKDACYPAGTVVVTQAVGTVTASWTWDNSEPCIAAKIANTQFTQTVPTPAKNEIDLKLKVGGAEIDGTFTITGDDDAVFSSKNDASSTYSRRKQVVNWYGNWDIVTKDEKLCNPDGTITISDYSSTRVRAQWTWAKTQPCVDAKLDGATFNEVIYISGNTVPLSFTVGEAKVEGIFAIINDQAVFANANGAAATFVRRQQLVNWVGLWDINQGSKSSGGCYPDGYITIIPEGGNLTSSWVWEKSDVCKQANLDGKTFTQSQPVPKGNGVFLDFIVGGAHVSGLFSCSTDKSCNFVSTKGASASFSRRTQLVSWAGVFDIATKDSTACYPDGAITVVRTTEKATDKTAATDKLTISWTWAKTDACKNLGLTGEVKKVVNTPTSGNSVSFDDLGTTTAPIAGLLTLFLDGAVFSITNGAATTYSRRQENVAFAGTWDIQSQTSETACYPNKSIVITQSGGNVVAKWTWADSAYCKGAGIDGKEFTQTTPSPKGRAIFLDIVVGSTATTITRISGLFSVNGNTAAFDSSNGASATFTRVSAPPSNGSSWGTIIIVLLVIVALGVGGYLYVQNRNKKLQSGLDNSISGAYTRT